MPELLSATLLVSSIIILYCFATYPAVREVESPEHKPRETEDRVKPILRQFSYTTYESNEVSNVVEADSLIVNPRRVGFFNVKNINEITSCKQ